MLVNPFWLQTNVTLENRDISLKPYATNFCFSFLIFTPKLTLIIYIQTNKYTQEENLWFGKEYIWNIFNMPFKLIMMFGIIKSNFELNSKNIMSIECYSVK